jgi:hypothetical protein
MTGVREAVVPVAPIDPTSAFVGSGARFAVTGNLTDDTLVVAVNYVTTSQADRSQVRVVTRSGGTLGGWTTPTIYDVPMVGCAYSPGNVWVLLAGRSTGGDPRPPRLLRFTIGGVAGFDIPLSPSGGPTFLEARDIGADREGKVVILGSVNGTSELRRYDGGGNLLLSQAIGNPLSAFTIDRSGLIYGADPVNCRLSVLSHGFSMLGTFGGAGTPLGPFPCNWAGYIGGDLDCRLYTTADNPDSMWVFLADGDGDALCDGWEEFGIRYFGGSSPFQLVGSDPLKRDLFVEIDAMQSHSITSRAADSLEQAFARAPGALMPAPLGAAVAAGVTLHLDYGTDQDIPDTSWAGQSVGIKFDDIKQARFGTPSERATPAVLEAKRLAYRYMLMVHDLPQVPGAPHRDGWAEQILTGTVTGGSDAVIGAEAWRAGPGADPKWQDVSGLTMHELGHLVGLRHGGTDDIANKPNYRSVMNWAYTTAKDDEVGAGWSLDYSRHPYLALNEADLNERLGVVGPLPGKYFYFAPRYPVVGDCVVPKGRERRRIDFDQDGVFEEHVEYNLTALPLIAPCGPDTSDKVTVLNPATDWDRLQFGSRYWRTWQIDGAFNLSGSLPPCTIRDYIAFIRAYSDCDGDAVPDSVELAQGAQDSNGNGVQDDCDLPLDGYPPGDVTDLVVELDGATGVILSFTAPGDDYDEGTATQYDVRWRQGGPFTAGNWASGTQVSGEPMPSAAGTVEFVTVSGLSECSIYYFAMKAADEDGNWSDISNSVGEATMCCMPTCELPPVVIPGDLSAAAGRSVAHSTIDMVSDQSRAMVVELTRSSSLVVGRISFGGNQDSQLAGGVHVQRFDAEGHSRSTGPFDLGPRVGISCSRDGVGRFVLVGNYNLEGILASVRDGAGSLTLEALWHSRLGDVLTDSAGPVVAPAFEAGDTLSFSLAPSSTVLTDTSKFFLLAGDRRLVSPSAVQHPRPTVTAIPRDFGLAQNSPNPFSGVTIIRFGLPRSEHVRITVYDLLGRRVATLVDAEWPAGFHTVEWDRRTSRGARAGPGVYAYRVEAGEFRAQRKMVLLP